MFARTTLRAVGGLLAILLTSACLTSTQATRVQTDLDEVRRQLFQVQQETTGSQQRLAAIDQKLGGGVPKASQGQADLNATLQTLLDRIQAMSAQMSEMQTRMGSLQQEIQALRAGGGRASGSPAVMPGPSGASPPPPMAGEDPETESFNGAYSDYSKGNYELAVMGFTDFLKSHAEHSLAPDAQYWIGECYFSQGKFKDAAEAFDRTIKSWPTCQKAAPALLKKGLSQMELGQTSRAVPTFQKVVEEHPDSEEARIAAARLQQLGLRSP